MRKVILSVLVVIVCVGAFAAAGYAGYRFGYAQGVQATAPDAPPARLRPFADFERHRMPLQRPGFERGGFPGMGFFPVWLLLGKIAFIGLIAWFVYWLAMRSGWRLTRQPGGHEPPKNE